MTDDNRKPVLHVREEPLMLMLAVLAAARQWRHSDPSTMAAAALALDGAVANYEAAIGVQP